MSLRGRLSDNMLSWSLIVGLSALAVRLLFVWQAQSHLLFNVPMMDMDYHHQWAASIAAGTDFIEGPFFRAPLYPYLLGAIYFLFGAGYWPILVIQSLMGAASAVLLLWVGRRALDLRTGVVAGLIFAIYGPLVFYTGLKLIPTLSIFLALAAIYCLLVWLGDQKSRWLWIAGLLLGLSAITRPTVLLFPVVVIAWVFWKHYRRRLQSGLKRLMPLVLGVVIPILPVTVYNFANSGEFIPIGTYGGMNFYIGNNADSDGISARLPGARKDWWGMMQDAERMAETESGRQLTEAEQSTFWLTKGMKDIASHPGHFLRNTLKRCVLLVQGIELSNNFDFYFFARKVPLLKYLIWQNVISFPYGLILPLAVIGLILGALRNEKSTSLALYLLAYIPAVVLFFVTARYRLPLVPLLILFASFGVVQMVRSWRTFTKLKSRLLLATLIVSLIFCNLDLYGTAPRNMAQGYHSLATMQVHRGRISQAEESYRRALAEDGTFAEAYNDLGLLVANKGDLAEAIQLLEKSTRLDPDNYVVAYNLAFVYLNSGQPEKAIAPLSQVIRTVPDDIHALNNLGLAYLRTDRYDSALTAFRRATAIDPAFADGWSNAALAYIQTGQSDSAMLCQQRAQARPDARPDGYYHLGRLWLEAGQADSAVANFRF